MDNQSKGGFIDSLIKDVMESEKQLRRNQNQGNKRNFVRCVSTTIEGLISMLVQNINSHKKVIPNLTIYEQAALEEESYYVKENGEVCNQKRFLTHTAKARMIVKIVQRYKPSLDIDFSGDDWESFSKYGSIRNRIVHPKGAQDLNISDEEVMYCRRAFIWTVILVLQTQEEHLEYLREFFKKAGIEFGKGSD